MISGFDAIRKLYKGLQMVQDNVTSSFPIPSTKGLSEKMNKVIGRMYGINKPDSDEPLKIIHIIDLNRDESNGNPFMLIVVDDNHWQPCVDTFMNDKYEPSYAIVVPYWWFDVDIDAGINDRDQNCIDIFEDIYDLFIEVASHDTHAMFEPSYRTILNGSEEDYNYTTIYDIQLAASAIYFANKTLRMWVHMVSREAIVDGLANVIIGRGMDDGDGEELMLQLVGSIDAAIAMTEENGKTFDQIVRDGDMIITI